jgi:hypothetical protein
MLNLKVINLQRVAYLFKVAFLADDYPQEISLCLVKERFCPIFKNTLIISEITSQSIRRSTKCFSIFFCIFNLCWTYTNVTKTLFFDAPEKLVFSGFFNNLLMCQSRIKIFLNFSR